MTKIIKLVLAAVFMTVVYLLLPILIKYYVDWVIDKKAIWIIFLTLFALTIPRIILNSIPIVIGKLTTNKDSMLLVATVINWAARTLYLFFIYKVTDFYNSKSIWLSVFMCVLFYAFSNFFAHGILKHVLLKDDNDD